METKTEKCKWCGRTHVVEQNPIYKKGGFGWNYEGHKGYCSDKCKLDAEGGNTSSSNNDHSYKMPEMSAENNAELARIQWEKEKAEKQEKAEKEAKYIAETAEKKAKREAKASLLREQGKPFMAFVTINTDTIQYISLFISILIAPIIFLGDFKSFIKILAGVILIGIYGGGIYKYLQEYFKK